MLQFNDMFNLIRDNRELRGGNASGLDDRVTQVQLITGPGVLNRALIQPEVGRLRVLEDVENPTFWLEDRVTAKFPGDSDLLHLTVRCTSEQSATTLADGGRRSSSAPPVERKRAIVTRRITSAPTAANARSRLT